MEIAPVNPRFLAVAPKTIATACLATSLSPFRYWTASPRKEKLAHVVLDLKHLRLFERFLSYFRPQICPEKLSKFFQYYLSNVLRSKAMEDPMKNHYHLSLVSNRHNFCDESFCDFFQNVHCHHYWSRRPWFRERDYRLLQFRLVVRTISQTKLTQSPWETATKECCQHTRRLPSMQTIYQNVWC